MASKLEGKAALITGASGGIGSATALEFAREGSRGIGIQYTTGKERAEALAADVRHLGSEAAVLQADISKVEDAKRLVEGVVDAFGALDILICLAGHPFHREEWFKPFEQLAAKDLMRPIEVDLLGSIYCSQAAIPHLRQSGEGRIVLVSSTPALTGDTVGISYLLAKGALISLTKSLAQYLGPDGIHVNCLVLGSIDTEAMSNLMEEERRSLEEEASLRRMGTPEEVARKAVYLASKDSDFQTGTLMVVDGGFAMW